MSSVLDDAVVQMLSGYSGRITAEKIKAFTDAIADEHQCERCAVTAARTLTRKSKYAPTPAVFVIETRDEQDSSAHSTHASDLAQLTSNDAAFWVTEAPAIVKRHWPELSGEAARDIAAVLAGYAHPNENAIACELGFVDKHGASDERQWWLSGSGVQGLPKIVRLV